MVRLPLTSGVHVHELVDRRQPSRLQVAHPRRDLSISPFREGVMCGSVGPVKLNVA